jgi:adenylate cyclase
MERRLAAILAADVVGYSRLIRADEEGTLDRLKALRNEMIDPKVAEHNGRIVKLMGDGMLAEFPSVVDAVRAAIEAQRSITEHNAGLPEEKRIEFRVGINLGDVVIDGDDIHGDGVNLAARLEGMAEPGGICVSGMVYEGVRDRIDILFEDMGEQKVKNIDRPVRMWRWAPFRGPTRAAAPPEDTQLVLPDKPSIAVLPFDNMSGDPEQGYFADGIAEDIITTVSKLSDLFVIARNSSFTYRDKDMTAQQVSAELGVRYLLEGSVRKAGSRVRVTAQLVDGTTGGHLWAEHYDRDLADIFAVQDDVTQKIVSNLAIKLTRDEKRRLLRKAPDNVEAYDHYLRGDDLLWRLTRDTSVEARQLLQQAIDLDPQLTVAYVILSHSHLLDYVNRWSESPEASLEQAHQLALQAVALDEDDPGAHWELGLTYLWLRQHDQAIAEEQRALALNPNSSDGHAALGHAWTYAGRPQESIELLTTAMRLDPHYSNIWLHFLAEAYFGLARYEEAAATLIRSIYRNPDTDVSRVLLAACYGHLDRMEEAREQWQDALRKNPDYSLEHKRRVLPYKNPADFERIVEGLRKAGVSK